LCLCPWFLRLCACCCVCVVLFVVSALACAETTDNTVPKTNAKHRVAHGLGNVVLDLQKLQFIFGVDVETADTNFANSIKSLPHSEQIKSRKHTNAKHRVAHGLGDVVLDLQKLQFIFGVDAETADTDFANSIKSLPHNEQIKRRKHGR